MPMYQTCYIPNLGTDAADGGATSTSMSKSTIKLAKILMAETDGDFIPESLKNIVQSL